MTRAETATRTAARLSEVRVSPILEIERAAAALRDRGVDVIALGTGEPDFDTPVHIVEAAERAMRGGRTRYTRLDGSPETKEAVCAKFERENGLRFSADEISVSTGAKQVLFNAFAATLDPGDEVLIPTPAWTSYADIVRINGGRAVFVPTRAADGFAPSAEAISRAIGPRTRWLLLNSPSNPTGAVLSADALRAVAEALAPHPDVLVLVDEIYEHLCFDAPFRSFGEVCPSLREHTLLVNGVSKAYAMTGWRLGYGAGPAWLIRAMAKVQSQTTSCPSSISQAAAVAALTETDPGFDARRDAYRRRRDRVVRTLDAIEGVSCATPAGAFYAFPRLERASDDVAACRWLLDSARVAMVPGSVFEAPGHVRLSFAVADDVLERALTRVEAAFAAGPDAADRFTEPPPAAGRES